MATVWAWMHHVAIPLVVHSCASAIARLRSCIVGRSFSASLPQALTLASATHSRQSCVVSTRQASPECPHSRSCRHCVWLPLGADTYVLIDQSTCLVEPPLPLPCLCCPAASTSGTKSTVAARDCPSARICHKVLSELLPPSCSVVVVVLDDCFEHHLALGALRSSLFSRCSRASLLGDSRLRWQWVAVS